MAIEIIPKNVAFFVFWYYFGALKFLISVLISKGRGPVIGIIELDIEYIDNAIELDGTARKFK